MAKIKLLQLGEEENGIKRLQSQLMIGRNVADFIIENNQIKCYGKGEKGFKFYPYTGEFEIVQTKEEMKYQEL